MSKIQNNIIINPLVAVSHLEGLGVTLFQCMKENGDNVAQIDAVTGEQETFDQLLQKCVRTAARMQSMGVKQGDVVTICSFNHLNTFVPLIAAWFIGAQVACTVPQLSLSDTVYLLKQIRPKLLFVSTNAVHLIENTLIEGKLDGTIVVFGETKTHMNFQDFIAPIDGAESFIPVKVCSIRDTALITFSSGTTSTPKGICISHYGILGAMGNELIRPNQVLMTSSGPYWLSSIGFLVLATISCGRRVVIPDFNETDVWNWIKEHKVNFVLFATSSWIRLSKRGRPDHADTSSLLCGYVCGSHISKNQMLAIRRIFPTSIIMNVYGLGEAGALGFGLNPLDDPINLKIYNEEPHSLGRGPPGTECKVVHIETEETLGPLQTGELRIRTDFSMNGYYGLDSSEAWDSEGFLKTGDLVYYDEDLCFYYVDRIKEMLKYRSWQISPVQLETIILSHPCVKNAIVVGVPDEEDGDHPIAFVELRKFATEEEIKKFVDEQVTETHRLRGGVKFVDSIPVSQTGKNRRWHIKNLFLHGEI